ncbi:MAG: 5'-nucleotidase, partial [Ideonella sp.]|nr:5'-nucleotidase [Ideonella sp.]
MPSSPLPTSTPEPAEQRLVVALSSRALFDFEEENQLFEAGDDSAYMRPQLGSALTSPCQARRPSSLARQAARLPAPGRPQAEVVILSRNDPASGLRVFRSCQHHG